MTVKPSDLAKQQPQAPVSQEVSAAQETTEQAPERPEGVAGATGTVLDGVTTETEAAAGSQDSAPTPPWGSDEKFDPERAWSLIQALRGDVAAQKAKLAPLEAAAEAARVANLSEVEKATEERDKANLAIDVWREQAIRSTAEAMVKGRFIDDDAALSLIGDLNVFADEGRVNTKKLQARLDKLAEDKPHLVAKAGLQPNRGQGGSASGPITPQQLAQQAENQQDWKGAASAKAQMLRDLRDSQV